MSKFKNQIKLAPCYSELDPKSKVICFHSSQLDPELAMSCVSWSIFLLLAVPSQSYHGCMKRSTAIKTQRRNLMGSSLRFGLLLNPLVVSTVGVRHACGAPPPSTSTSATVFIPSKATVQSLCEVLNAAEASLATISPLIDEQVQRRGGCGVPTVVHIGPLS